MRRALAGLASLLLARDARADCKIARDEFEIVLVERTEDGVATAVTATGRSGVVNGDSGLIIDGADYRLVDVSSSTECPAPRPGARTACPFERMTACNYGGLSAGCLAVCAGEWSLYACK